MVAKYNAEGIFESGIPVKTVMGAPAAADILAGSLSHTATTAAMTLITVPAGRTWSGTITVAVAASTAAASAAAGQARAFITTAGAGVTPAAGALFAAEARAAANAATGTSGDSNSTAVTVPVVVVAPTGNAVTVQVASTITTGVVDVAAVGSLI